MRKFILCCLIVCLLKQRRVVDGHLNSPADQSCVQCTDVQIGWVDDNAANVFSYTWSFKSASASSFQDILTWTSGTVTNADVLLNNVAYVSDATISLALVTAAYAGTYKCTVLYTLGQTPASDSDAVTITVANGHLNSPADQRCAQGPSVWTVVGAAFGALAVCILVGATGLFVCRRLKRQRALTINHEMVHTDTRRPDVSDGQSNLGAIDINTSDVHDRREYQTLEFDNVKPDHTYATLSA